MAGKTGFSTTLREAALQSGCPEAELVRGLMQWVRSRRSAEFIAAWDRNCGPDGPVMLVRNSCVAEVVQQGKRSRHTEALRQLHETV